MKKTLKQMIKTKGKSDPKLELRPFGPLSSHRSLDIGDQVASPRRLD